LRKTLRRVTELLKCMPLTEMGMITNYKNENWIKIRYEADSGGYSVTWSKGG